MTDASPTARLIRLAKHRAKAAELRDDLDRLAWLLHPSSPYRRDQLERQSAESDQIEKLEALAALSGSIAENEIELATEDLANVDPALRRLLVEPTEP